MRVHPTLIPEQKQLANVDGVLNAIMIKGDAVGELVLVGPGAGGAATASAVCADLADIARTAAGSGPALGVPMGQLKSQTMVPADDIESEWYVRLAASDCAGVMSDVTQVLANHDVSIESLLQNPPQEDQATVSIVLLTHVASASVMMAVMQEITALTEVETDFTLLRVEAFDQ
jgi:homoserine dehydrogenase